MGRERFLVDVRIKSFILPGGALSSSNFYRSGSFSISLEYFMIPSWVWYLEFDSHMVGRVVTISTAAFVDPVALNELQSMVDQKSKELKEASQKVQDKEYESDSDDNAKLAPGIDIKGRSQIQAC